MLLSCEKYSLLSNLEESNAQIVEEFEKQLDVNEKVLSDLHEVELRLREMVDDKLAAVVTPADVATPPPSSVDVEPSRLSSPPAKVKPVPTLATRMRRMELRRQQSSVTPPATSIITLPLSPGCAESPARSPSPKLQAPKRNTPL